MPEEVNRVIADHLSTLLLTTLASGERNLAAEHIPRERVVPVGNTMIDTLLANETSARELAAWRDFDLEPGGYVLVTLHRPRLVDDPVMLERTMSALDDLARTLPVVFPVHPRTRKNLTSDPRHVRLVDPLPYQRFLSLETEAAAVLTDSGGVQEETTALGVRCFTLRANTERPETQEGTNVLLGLDPEAIRRIPELLTQPVPRALPEQWDGHAGERAAQAIETAL
jgi:UDP-N-acetylglucosamine 2-epimerase (non-hydrolysing)